MEAWIVAIAAVFTIVYQAVIGPRSIAQWLQDSKKHEVESEIVQAARAQLEPEEVQRIERNVSIRKTLRRALSDLYMRFKQRPGKAALQLLLSVYLSFVALLIILFISGAFMAVIGYTFGLTGTTNEGLHLLEVGGGVGAIVAMLSGAVIFVVLEVTSDYQGHYGFLEWWNKRDEPVQEPVSAPKRRKRTSGVAAAKRTPRSQKSTLE